ncbi:hypothetical protein BDM02DRAFT_1366837 [Thelephora ganbajun]|uniref:Uncharacterized protein n=1 Tax=Thelephora ganbajun TaxID=370292 RepID=A0ACB6Z2I5_THEGA|nr:hypothetical protein BDM02DRAFT_1366837 [Thelephora ganbajun]
MDLVFESFMANGDQTLTILNTNCYLIMAISLGLQIDIWDLYAPSNKCAVPHFSYGVCSLGDSDALQVAINLFHQRLQLSIREAKASPWVLKSILSALVHLDPFQTVGTRELVFLWITEILNSEYPEDERCEMASRVVKPLGKHFGSKYPTVERAWVPPLLRFFSLSERFDTPDVPPYPRFTALRILSVGPVYTNFDATFLPALASTLLPTHPLQSRSPALKVFCRFIPGWFSPQIENVLDEDLDKLVQAVGDSFVSTPDIPLQDGKPKGTVDYDPIMTAVVLIEFASSDLWRNHLHRLNFVSYGEIVSTEEGRRAALQSMLKTADNLWRELLCTPTKIIMAIRRLEELQCLNTAEIVILWAWTIGVIEPMDHDGWRLIGNETFRFYQTHGTGRLTALKRHAIDNSKATEYYHLGFLWQKRGYRGPCRVKSAQRHDTNEETDRIDLRVSRVCQLRRLYNLFGYDPMTWEEVVAVEEMGEEMDVSSGRSITPVPFIDSACDYP